MIRYLFGFAASEYAEIKFKPFAHQARPSDYKFQTHTHVASLFFQLRLAVVFISNVSCHFPKKSRSRSNPCSASYNTSATNQRADPTRQPVE